MCQVRFHQAIAMIAAVIALSSPLLAPPAHGAWYQETFDGAPNDVMMGILHFGAGEVWQGDLRGGTYYLGNQSDEQAVNLYFIGALPNEPAGLLGEAVVSVDVGGTYQGQRAGSGLIYRFSDDPLNYYAFLLMQGNSYGLFQRDASGFTLIASAQDSAIAVDRMNRLTAATYSDGIWFYINGKHVQTVPAPGFGGSSVGIIAKGLGEHFFDNFTVER